MIPRRATADELGTEESRQSTCCDLCGHLRLHSICLAAVAVADAIPMSLYQMRERGGCRLAGMSTGVSKACLLWKNCSHLVSRDTDIETAQLDDKLPYEGLCSRSNNDDSLRHGIVTKACQWFVFRVEDDVHTPS